MDSAESQPTIDVVVVGGGAAGVGVAIALRHAGVERLVVLEREQVGASFARWPAETRFITPSFATNSFGMLDLNSVAIGVSPAFSLEVEHPTGQEYAAHLGVVAKVFEVPVIEGVEVTRIERKGEGFLIDTSGRAVEAKCVVWAAGEFQYPRQEAFIGSELCTHTATIDSYDNLEGDDFIIIGGYESGVDAAYHLAYRNKLVRMFDSGNPWESVSSDPSISLSPFSLERMREDWFFEQVELHPNTRITAVVKTQKGYTLTAADGTTFFTGATPILAGGFAGGHTLIAELFDLRPDGFPALNEHDESTRTQGLYLCGPSIRHDNHIFCFIYKFRQRFAVVASAIATSLGLPAEGLDTYRNWGMYLDDLSTCGEDCVC